MYPCNSFSSSTLYGRKKSCGIGPEACFIFEIIFNYPDFDLPAFLKCLTLLGLTTKALLLFRLLRPRKEHNYITLDKNSMTLIK